MPERDSDSRDPTQGGSEDSSDGTGHLIDSDRRAAAFRQTRQSRQAEIAEDYIELICDLIDATGEARIVDLAERLGVTHATVNKHLVRLQNEGLIKTRPYRAIFLTDSGRRMAETVRRRHLIVEKFLMAIGVSRETACTDAEGIEHHVSAETLEAFERVLHNRGLLM